MKRFLSLVLVLMLTLSLFVSVTAETTVENITFWYCMSDRNGQLLQEAVNTFNTTVGLEAGIHVEAIYQGSYSDAVTKVNATLNATQYDLLPNVLQMDATGKVMYYTSGQAYTVDAMLAEDTAMSLDDFLPAALSNWNYSGAQLGLPFATSTTVLYYNKTLLDQLDMPVPDVLSDFSAIAEKLPEGITCYASVPNTPTLANWLGQLGSDLVDKNNGSEGSAAQLVCIENGALARFLSVWKDLYAAGGVANNSGSTDAFVAGTQMFMTSSSSSLASVISKVGAAFEVGIAQYPRVSADSMSGASVSGSCLVAFDHGDAANRAERVFMQYMTSADVQAAFAAGSGYVPSVLSAAETDTWQQLITGNSAFGVALEQISNTPVSMRAVTVGPAADFYYSIMTCISDMLDDDLSIEETIDIMQSDLNGLLDQYNRSNP